MKIKQEYKVREIAGENVVIMQGRQGADLTQIVTLNAVAFGRTDSFYRHRAFTR